MEKFSGPVFVVGMPRSGTKLVRELLNNHSKLFFPSYESEILPYWAENWEKYGDVTQFSNFEKFYNEAIKKSFFTYMQRKRSVIISAREWHSACRGEGVAEVFEALIRLDTKCTSESIWGDKSPSYIQHITLLKQIYPSAKIIHIVRDVRDYCLSINKAWGKNMLRAAQRWQDDTHQASKDIAALGKDGIEIRFEDLLTHPRTTLQNLCQFIGVNYEDQLTTLTQSVENIGDAKGSLEIIKENKEKWPLQMSAKQITQIESLSAPQLRAYKYPVSYQGKCLKISQTRLKIYQLVDAFNMIIHKTSDRKIVNRIIFYLRFSNIKIR